MLKIRRLLLPLILIFILTSILIGDCAWLAGWDKRIELAINDYAGDIGASVTWFPATIHLKNANGGSTKVFLEVGANYRKIAITKVDGTTELKGEIEKWSYDAGTPANSTAVIHTSADGWVINDDTKVYVYYDKDHADNDNINVIDTAAGAAVWDGNFKAVYHMVDATTSTVLDSTSNSNDGTKKAANEPLQVEGKVGKAQSFDGVNDLMTLSSIALASSHQLTVEGIVNFPSAITSVEILVEQSTNYNSNDAMIWLMGAYTTDKFSAGWRSNVGSVQYDVAEVDAALSQETDYMISTVFDATLAGTANTVKNYVNGGIAADTTKEDTASDRAFGDFDWFLGDRSGGGVVPCKYILSEFRVSNTDRTAAWIKATYNSLFDSLFTYGDEETEGVVKTNVLFTFTNF